MARRPKWLAHHIPTTHDTLEERAHEHGGSIVYGAGWATLDLGRGRKFCAPDPASASVRTLRAVTC